jgi:hypothetical protein
MYKMIDRYKYLVGKRKGTGDLSVNARIILNIFLKEEDMRCAMDSTGSRQCPMTDFSKNCNELSDSLIP